MNSKVEFVMCRKCHKEFARWSQPYCRYCWKKFFKNTQYIPTREEINEYCRSEFVIEKDITEVAEPEYKMSTEAEPTGKIHE
jgi:hypothetical protein